MKIKYSEEDKDLSLEVLRHEMIYEPILLLESFITII